MNENAVLTHKVSVVVSNMEIIYPYGTFEQFMLNFFKYNIISVDEY